MFFFFNDTAPPEIYTLSLHAALPIFAAARLHVAVGVEAFRVLPDDDQIEPTGPPRQPGVGPGRPDVGEEDRKSTRLNSSHANISYAVFCLKKNKIYLYTDFIHSHCYG